MHRRILLVAALAVAPVALAAGAALAAVAWSQWQAADAKSLEVTRLSAAAIDVELERSVATLNGLAASLALQAGDVAAARRMLEDFLPQMPGWHALTLRLPDGRLLVNTALPDGDPLPPPSQQASFDRVVRTQAPAIGDLVRAPGERMVVPVRVPVVAGTRLRYVLTAWLTPEAILRVVAAQGLPPDWVLSVFDATGARVARSREHARYLGTPAAPSLQELMLRGGRSGTGITRTLEGTTVSSSYVRLPGSDWAVAIGIPTAQVVGQALNAFAIYGAGALMSVLLALFAAGAAARALATPIVGLRGAAERMGRGDMPAVPETDIPELAALGEALTLAAQARAQLEAERSTALAELVTTHGALRQRVTDLERLHRLSQDLLKLPTVQEQVHAVLAALCELHGAPKGLVSLWDAPAHVLRVQASIGFSPAALAQLRCVAPGDGACGIALRDECRVVVADTEQDPRFAAFRDMARAEGFRSVHSTPIRSGVARVLGVISVHAPAPGYPDERQERLADLCARLCAMFIERTLAEQEAAAAAQRLRMALDSSNLPFSILVPQRDERGVVVDFVCEYLNAAAAAATGKPEAEFAGRPLGTIVPEIWRAPGLFDAYLKAVESGAAQEVQVSTATGGVPREWQVVATPFENKLAVWCLDITVRAQQAQALRAADRRKDEFLAVLAHELRNPLAPIQHGALISAAPGASEAQQRWSREIIVRQVRHMALLLDDLLDVSRITRGKLELRKARVQVKQAIEAALETARPHLEGKGHRFELDLPDEPLWVDADELRLAQIVTNLLTNAARYTRAGGSIRVRAAAEAGQARITVSDDGSGIPATHLESIFEMFAQGPNRGDGGLGIGLALSRGIAQLHGGSLTASSDGPGMGSVFTLTLPLTTALPDGAGARAPAAASRERKLRVVVAHDNRDAADTLATVLRLSGHEVLVAYEARTAIAHCQNAAPDAAILDIGMPGMSGYEAAQRIRESVVPPPVLIALTGWGQSRDKRTAAQAGFDHHFTKPVDTAELLLLLQARPKVERLRPSPADERVSASIA